MLQDKKIGIHVFTLNPQDNGGETVDITTTLFHNGDPGAQGIFLNQEITLQSYCNSASFNLHSATLTPELLRKFADELEEQINRAAQSI